MSPPAIGLGLVATVLMGGMSWLGWWQYSAYNGHQREDALERLSEPPVPLDTVLGPDAAFPGVGVGRPVTVTGEFVGADQIYVRHYASDVDGLAYVTPLRTDSGSAILVVRGAAVTSTPHSVPAGPVSVTGVLEPSQDRGTPVDMNRVADGLRLSSLLSAFDYDLYSGYVILDAGDLAVTGLEPIEPSLPDASRWAGLRNLVYAVQWWLFAAFTGFMWWRVVADGKDEPASAHP